MCRETLLASLIAIGDEGAVQLDNGGYIDFSMPVGDGRGLEVSDGEEAIQLTLTREELIRLHAALTRTLLASA